MADPARLCLLSVHAHPDDEASKGAGSVAAHDEGVHTVLVTCTDESGDILNPAMSAWKPPTSASST
jgi:mycothiol S-conjugate amidase